MSRIKDPELRRLDDGRAVANFSIATSETYKNKSGEKVTNTEWHNIVVRNKAAELCQKYLSKGDKVYIEGKIKSRKWTDDSGKERYMNEINADVFTFLNNKNDDRQLNSPESEVNETFDSDTKEQDLPF